MRATVKLGILIFASAASVLTGAIADDLRQIAPAPNGVADTAEPVADSARRAVVDLITHDWIEIDRPPAVVWPFIVNSNTWTQLNLLHRGGPMEQVGELLSVVDPARRGAVLALAENVEMTPQQRRTFKVYGKDGQLGGYVNWTLKAVNGRTVVTYDLYYESMIADEKQPPQAARDKANQKPQSELLTLKKLAESK